MTFNVNTVTFVYSEELQNSSKYVVNFFLFSYSLIIEILSIFFLFIKLIMEQRGGSWRHGGVGSLIRTSG